jgi:urea carboxylase
LQPRGHAIQARLYAEDPGREFQPSPGLLTAVDFPAADGQALRIDTWVEAGCEIPPYFDPMIAKLISWQPTREAARAALHRRCATPRSTAWRPTALPAPDPRRCPFASGQPWTRCLEQLVYRADTVEVLARHPDHGAGLSRPHRLLGGRCAASGPMDERALRLGNRLLGNAEDAAGLEMTMSGPAALQYRACVVVTGAVIPVLLDGVAQPMATVLHIAAGSTLKLGTIAGAGARSYLAVRGGVQVPAYLGSRSTFTLGQFGGHAAARWPAATSCICCRWPAMRCPRPARSCRLSCILRWKRCGRSA